MSINSEDKIIWVDVLSFTSIYKIYRKRKNFDKIVYFNSSIPFSFLINFLSKKIFCLPLISFNFLSESEVKIKGISLFEYIQNSLTKKLNSLSSSERIIKRAKSFSDSNKLVFDKFIEHIKGSAFLILYRPVAILSISEYFQCKKDNLFILSSNPLNDFILDDNPNKKIFFDKYGFLLNILLKKRKEYHFDKYIYLKPLKQKIIFLIDWVVGLIGEILFLFSKNEKNKNNIGVDLTQPNFRHDMSNDIFWLQDSQIEPNSVIGFLERDYDNESIEQIKNTGINIKVTIQYLLRRPLKFFFLLKRVSVIKLGVNYYLSSLINYLSVFMNFRANNTDSWLNSIESLYILRLNYLESMYRKLGIKILWSMFDIDDDKLVKFQALDNIGGLYTGSHWGNTAIYTIWGQKSYHLSFVWSQHFINSVFSKSSYPNYKIVGYISDYLFQDTRLKNENNDKKNFIVTYFDNTVGKDIPYSNEMQKNIYKIFFKLLKKYDHFILYLKPKKYSEIPQIFYEDPEIRTFIKKNRIKLFVNSNQKISPHIIGQKSDLAVGIGISTAAAECCFAGTISFHADLTGFVNNEFANNALGKVVFRDINNLEIAIENQILGKGISYNECKNFHYFLDPFQDGKAYLRVGNALKDAQQYLIQAKNNKDVIKKLDIN